MTFLLACTVAFAATLLTTLAVLALWTLHARVVEKSPVDTVLLPLIFLFVPLIFFVSAFSNIVGVVIGQLAGLSAPSIRLPVTVGTAGVLVWLACAWSQQRWSGFTQGSQPVAFVQVALFCVTDMAILWGGLSLLPTY